MFGYSSLEELPDLPKYKMDENRQIVIDDLIEEDKEQSNESNLVNNINENNEDIENARIDESSLENNVAENRKEKDDVNKME